MFGSALKTHLKGPLFSFGEGDRDIDFPSPADSAAGSRASSRGFGSTASVGQGHEQPNIGFALEKGGNWSSCMSHDLGSSVAERFADLDFLDWTRATGVRQAVQRLNTGEVQSSQGICLVFSQTRGVYYLLWREDKEAHVWEAYRVKRHGADSATPTSSPRQLATSEQAVNAQSRIAALHMAAKERAADSFVRGHEMRLLRCTWRAWSNELGPLRLSLRKLAKLNAAKRKLMLSALFDSWRRSRDVEDKNSKLYIEEVSLSNNGMTPLLLDIEKRKIQETTPPSDVTPSRWRWRSSTSEKRQSRFAEILKRFFSSLRPAASTTDTTPVRRTKRAGSMPPKKPATFGAFADADMAAGTPRGLTSFADRCRDSTPKSCRSMRSPKSCRSMGSGVGSVSSRGRRRVEEEALRAELAMLREEMARLQNQVAARAYEA